MVLYKVQGQVHYIFMNNKISTFHTQTGNSSLFSIINCEAIFIMLTLFVFSLILDLDVIFWRI